jgi:hypothetical protein
MGVLVTLKTRNGPEQTFIAESVERKGIELGIRRKEAELVKYQLTDLEYWTKVDGPPAGSQASS